MYPQRELIQLAVHKAALRRKIALRRAGWREAGAVVAQPWAWLDRALSFGRKLSPWIKFGALPLAFLLRRTFFPRSGFLPSILRWGPLVFSAARGLGFAFLRGAPPAKSPDVRPKG